MAYLILESGQSFKGQFRGGLSRAGEVVFNTSHSGYEEMATDPSYFSQILVTTAPQQGNYGIDRSSWESKNIWINGFVCLEIQNSKRDSSWLNLLKENGVPILSGVDTRELVLVLRSQGTTWGAISQFDDLDKAKAEASELIQAAKKQPAKPAAKNVARVKASESPHSRSCPCPPERVSELAPPTRTSSPSWP